MATHSSILAWEMLWTEEPVRLQSIGSRRVRHDWVIECTHTLTRGQDGLSSNSLNLPEAE